MTCPSCSTENPAHARFCLNCGRSITGPTNPNIAHAPASSLERLAPREYVQHLMASSGRVVGERRVLTILFFDITGSTAMAETLDPEDVMEIMNGAFEALVEPIYRYEGTLARLMGDGILCFFGAPIAHEDDPARACHTALDIIERARRYRHELERRRGITGFDVRVGLNTGFVVVGEVGTDLRVEYTAMGDAVNLAARMEASATPGTVLMTENTHAMVADQFDARDLGAIRVKGRKEAIRVFELVGARASQDAGDEHARLPVVGRGDEMSRLGAVVTRTCKGHGGVVTVVGAAGVGKSRLLLELERLAGETMNVVHLSCASYAQEMSHEGMRRLVRALLGVAPDANAETVLETIQHRFDHWGIVSQHADEVTLPPSAREVSSGISTLFGAAKDTRGTPGEQRWRMRNGLLGVLRLAARDQPQLIAWDDFHWLDTASRVLLESVVGGAVGLPVLLALAFRPGEASSDAFHQRLEHGHGKLVERISLGPLAAGASASLLRRLLGAQAMSDKTLQLLLDTAGGNPFFLEQVVRVARDAGVMDADRGRPIDASEIKRLGIPKTLHAAVMAQLDQLPAEDRRVLQVAAVIGRIFDRRPLAAAVDGDVHDEQLDTCLVRLCQRGLIAEQRTAGPDPGSAPRQTLVWKTGPMKWADTSTAAADNDAALAARYFFTQAITVEVAYSSLLRSQRREIHQRVGAAIERDVLGGCDNQVAVAAYHFEKAGIRDRAVHYLLEASQCAARAGAPRAAIECLSRIFSTPEIPGTDTSDALADDVLLTAHERMADLQVVVGSYVDAVAHYEVARSLTDDGERGITLLRKTAHAYRQWGKYDEAKTRFEAALALLRKPLNVTEAAHVYTGLAAVSCHTGALDEALDLGKIAVELMEGIEDKKGIAQACNNLSIVHLKKGACEAAAELQKRCLSMWDDIGDDYGRATALNNMGLIERVRGDRIAAAAHLRESMALFEKIGNRHGMARAMDNLGQVRRDDGHADEAISLVEKATAVLAEISIDKDELTPEVWQDDAW